ncbi:MAG: aldehyde dehydrogenase family protein [Cyclobacteriaceae bacterium]|nr:aldehyde dehydrogenase family protein [Cyclobacteriaceae bacterium]
MVQIPITDTSSIQRIFEAQRANQYHVAQGTARDRILKLQRLSDSVMKYRGEIREALYKDYRRHAAEVDLVEIFPITSTIKHTKRHLRRWMAPQKVATPMSMLGSSSWIEYEPKGVSLIIGPWNFPVMLVLVPLVSAIAAGNTAIIKPSEITPNSSAVVKKIIREVFEEGEVAVIEGGVETSTSLLELPFHHIFFTGSPEVGKIVMAAAAKNLTSVTLELGGKSPTIIDETADIEIAASRLSGAKFMNNGQICIAPDYVLVHESRLNAFIDAMKNRIRSSYGDNAAESESYMRIVNARNFQRVQSYLQDSIKAGAKVVHGGNTDASDNFIEPTLVTDLPPDSPLMQKEIFGPVLPIMPYKDLQEVIDFLQSKEKPLGLYIYSKNRQNIKRILQSTRAGGTCINNNAVHFFNPNLPFGGSNNSGIGKSHGRIGFIGFSNERAVYKQNLPSVLDWLVPPYTAGKMKLIDFTIKWF